MNFCRQNFVINFFHGFLFLFLLSSWATLVNRWNLNASDFIIVNNIGAFTILCFWEISIILLHIFYLPHYFCFTIGSISFVNSIIFLLISIFIILIYWGRYRLLNHTIITNDFGIIDNFVGLSIGNLGSVLARKNGKNCIVVTFFCRWKGIFFTVNSSEHCIFNANQISLSLLAWVIVHFVYTHFFDDFLFIDKLGLYFRYHFAAFEHWFTLSCQLAPVHGAEVIVRSIMACKLLSALVTFILFVMDQYYVHILFLLRSLHSLSLFFLKLITFSIDKQGQILSIVE